MAGDPKPLTREEVERIQKASDYDGYIEYSTAIVQRDIKLLCADWLRMEAELVKLRAVKKAASGLCEVGNE